MTRVRSPLALVASLACLGSAAIMAGALVTDPQPNDLASVHEGDQVEVVGELEPWTQEGWEAVAERLWGTTYLLDIPDVPHVVLLTGMEPGLEHQELSATAVVLLQVPHPERAVDIILLAPAW